MVHSQSCCCTSPRRLPMTLSLSFAIDILSILSPLLKRLIFYNDRTHKHVRYLTNRASQSLTCVMENRVKKIIWQHRQRCKTRLEYDFQEHLRLNFLATSLQKKKKKKKKNPQKNLWASSPLKFTITRFGVWGSP